MKSEEYKDGLQHAGLCFRLMETINVPAMINAINHAEAVGPIFHPSLFIEKETKMEEDKKILEALLPLWELFHKVKLESSPKAVNVTPGIVAIREELSNGS